MPTLDDDLRDELHVLYLHPVQVPDIHLIIRRGRRRRLRRRRGALGLGFAVVVAAAVLVGPLTADAPERIESAGPPSPAHANSDPAAQLTGAFGRLEIPAIDVHWVFLGDMNGDALRRGPGRYPGSALPGELGNSAIAGHRTTYGAPFLRLDELVPGNEIVIKTADQTFTYVVRETLILEPDAVEVLRPTFWSDRWGLGPTSTLTLTTEHPAFSSTERLVVGAELQGDPINEYTPTAGPSDASLGPG